MIRVLVGWILAVALCFWTLPGCGSGGLPGTVPIRGQVIYHGEPLGDGEVRYVPVDKQGRVARGPIQPDEPGRTVAEPGQASAPSQPIERGYLVPRKYTHPDQTPLEDVVDEDHSGYKELVLED